MEKEHDENWRIVNRGVGDSYDCDSEGNKDTS